MSYVAITVTNNWHVKEGHGVLTSEPGGTCITHVAPGNGKPLSITD